MIDPQAPFKKNTLLESLWNGWCIASIVGIWPRFIEPKLLLTSKITLPIQNLPRDLQGFKILHISDLHLCRHTSTPFLNRITHKVQSLKPDLIAFTGDFLCYGKFQDQERLLPFLNQLKAPYGCFAVPGNHDYNQFISVDDDGNYDVLSPTSSTLSRGFKRLFHTVHLTKKRSEQVKKVHINPQLKSLLKETPFLLLENETQQVPIKNTVLNITGTGEYIADQCLPEKAFQNFNPLYPGIVLAHNPDSFERLKDTQGDLILSGHTHGGQVNLPWLWKKFTLSENMSLKKGLFKFGSKALYVNRGLGSVMPFRWFSPPEITLFTLEPSCP